MRVRRGGIGFAAGLVALAAPAGAQECRFTPLRGAREPVLQAALEQSLRGRGYESLVKKKQLAVALAGITDPCCPRFAGVNGNVMMYAASLPKIAILLAAFKRIERGEMDLDAPTQRLLEQMIRKSSNTAATKMIERVGRQFINEVLQSPEYRLYDPDTGGGLWVGKVYGKAAAWRRDPLYNLSHGATAIQVARFYYLLETGKLLEPGLAAKMKEIMGTPGVRHKFVAGLRDLFPTALMFRKSGTWREYHSDSAIIERDGKRYVAVGMLHSPRGGEVLKELIVDLDRLIFEIPPHCPGEGAAGPPQRSSEPVASGGGGSLRAPMP